jgi:hypothetical protein
MDCGDVAHLGGPIGALGTVRATVNPVAPSSPDGPSHGGEFTKPTEAG